MSFRLRKIAQLKLYWRVGRDNHQKKVPCPRLIKLKPASV